MTRERSCDSPAPEYGGAPCEGEPTQQRSCRGAPCRESALYHHHHCHYCNYRLHNRHSSHHSLSHQLLMEPGATGDVGADLQSHVEKVSTLAEPGPVTTQLPLTEADTAEVQSFHTGMSPQDPVVSLCIVLCCVI